MQTEESLLQDFKPIYIIDGVEHELDKAGIIGKVEQIESDKEGVMQFKFYWALDIYAKKNAEGYTPKFSFIMLEQKAKFERNKYFSWDHATAYDTAQDTWLGSFYIYDRHYFECSISLTRVDKLRFLVKVSGQVDTNFEMAPSRNFKPFQIEQIVGFYGIRADHDMEGIVRAIASGYIDTEGMIWEEDTHHYWLDYPRKG